MIAELNKDFIPLELNLTESKFPESMPGLSTWRWIYALIPTLKNGFVSTVILDSSGKTQIVDAGTSNIWEVSTAINYNPDKYLAFLKDGLKRFQELKKSK